MENRTILLIMLIAILGVFIYLTRMFFVPFVVALTMANIFEPVMLWCTGKLKGRRGASAALTTLLIILVVALPVYLVAQTLVVQGIDLYSTIRAYLRDPGIGPLMEQVGSWPLFNRVDLSRLNWADMAGKALSQTASVTTKILNKTSAGVLSAAFGTFVVFFALFFFLRDGKTLLDSIKEALPMENRHVERIAREFKGTSRAAVSATVIIGIIQGAVGALTFLFIGFSSWLVWGVIMTILSIIPMVGSYIIMVPAAVVLLASGRIGAAVFILVMATVVSYGVDYLLRPRLVGRDAKMHDLLVFASSLGGLAVFGIMGFIVGPVIASLLVAMLTIFKEGLDLPEEELSQGQGPEIDSPETETDTESGDEKAGTPGAGE